jgi:hypothetical protein
VVQEGGETVAGFRGFFTVPVTGCESQSKATGPKAEESSAVPGHWGLRDVRGSELIKVA